MSLATAIAAIRSRLDASWTATDIVHESRRYEPAADRAFVLCEVASSPASFAGIGAPGQRLARRPGAILVHVFVPLADADPDAIARAHAAAIGGIYEGADFAGVVCRAASVGAGAEASDTFWRVTAAIPFVFDEIV